MILTDISLLGVTSIQAKTCHGQRNRDSNAKEHAKYHIETTYNWILLIVGGQPVQNEITYNHQSNTDDHIEKAEPTGFALVISCKRNSKKDQKSINTVLRESAKELMMQPIFFKHQ